MAGNELLLLHSTEGGKNMACRMKYSPLTGGYARICSPKRKRQKALFGDIGGVGELGAFTSLKATLTSIKPVLINGAVAAGGAILADKLFTKLETEVINKDKIRVKGIPLHLMLIATGLVLGIVVGKFTKKPALAAMLAMGPVMVGALRIFSEIVKQPTVAGMGMMSIEPYRETYSDARPQLGAMQIGPGVPNWMMEPKGEFSGIQGYQ